MCIYRVRVGETERLGRKGFIWHILPYLRKSGQEPGPGADAEATEGVFYCLVPPG